LSKIIVYLTACVLVLSNHSAYAETGVLKTVGVVEIEKRINYLRIKGDPVEIEKSNIMLPAEEQAEILEVELKNFGWSLDYYETFAALIYGNTNKFNESLKLLIETSEPDRHPSRPYILAQLMSILVELETDDLDLTQMEKIFNEIRLARTSYVRAEWKMIQCSFFFVLNKLEDLEQVSLQPSTKGDEIYNAFADAYCKLKLAESTGENDDLLTAIASLEDLEKILPESDDVSTGRVQMHLARAYRLNDEQSGKVEGSARTLVSAKKARQLLELLIVPHYWASAHKTSSELFGQKLNLRDKILSDRAHLLSTQF
jgi:hypothetical protein